MLIQQELQDLEGCERLFDWPIEILLAIIYHNNETMWSVEFQVVYENIKSELCQNRNLLVPVIRQ